MADLTLLQTRLTEAEAALHRLATTGRTVQVQVDGRMVSYAPAAIGELQSYINWLREEIRAASNPSASRVFTINSSRGLR